MTLTGAAAAPFCSWLIAAYLSRTVAGLSGEDPGSKQNISRRRSRRKHRNAQGAVNGGSSLVCSYSAGPVGSLVGLCGSGLSELGSCLSFEACPEYQSASWTPFFGEGVMALRPKPLRAARRHPKTAAQGKAWAIALQPLREPPEKKKLMTKERRVVVTGMGVVSCLGHDPEIFYNNLLEGKSGITEIENFNCEDFPTRIGGEIKSLSTDGWVSPKFAKRMDKFMLYLLTAGKKAVADAGMTPEVMKELDKGKCGVLIGSALGGMQVCPEVIESHYAGLCTPLWELMWTTEPFVYTSTLSLGHMMAGIIMVFNDAVEALRVSYRKMNPFCVPFATTNMGSAMLAMDLGWMGPSYSISTACATSNFCILSAANHIIRGEADIMLSGGSDAAIIPIGLGGFVACRALSQRNNDPAKASRPWDQDRDGFVLGEGAGVLVLEELEHAKERGAEIYAEFLGGSSTCDAYHMTEPHPKGTGILLCIEKALSQTGVKRQDVNYVNAHATSTKAGDVQEYRALMQSFGQNPVLKMNSTKSMIGHMLGAAGAVEAIATVQAIRTGWIHPTINVEQPEKDVDMDYIVSGKKQRLNVKVALSNSFGFGGHNSSILFAPYRESTEN